MPTYGYECNNCKHQFSKFQNMKDDPIKICPECQGEVKRLMYPVGIVFKGSGWYINDSRGVDKSELPEPAPKAESKDTSDTKTEAPKAEPAKAETPAATPAKE